LNSFTGFQIGERIKSFKPKRLLYYDAVPNQNADSKYELVSLDTLLAESDILICMCSLTKQTEGLFNMDLFRKMKPSAVFINASRGPVVNQDDLCEALKTQTIAAAGYFLCSFETIQTAKSIIKIIFSQALMYVFQNLFQRTMNFIS
jgi:phosphoglycerate dehydrogenase-like enzyme